MRLPGYADTRWIWRRPAEPVIGFAPSGSWHPDIDGVPWLDDVDELAWTGPTDDFAEICDRIEAPNLLARAQRAANKLAR